MRRNNTMATLEQVEKLRERANVSYDEAKAALEAAGDNLLEAMIYLEKQGKVRAPSGGGYYSSEKNDGRSAEPASPRGERAAGKGETFSDILKRCGRFCMKLLHKGNVNTFEVLKREEIKGSMPVTVLVLLLIFAFWITLPLMIIGLFFGMRYRFNGPDLGGGPVNQAMDSAAKAAEDIKKSLSDEEKKS
jgi:hypothetical protein